jgi:hypothetical protein
MSFDQLSLQLPCPQIIKQLVICNADFLFSLHVLCISNTDFSFLVLTFSVLTFALVKELAHANESKPAKLVVKIITKFENSFVSALCRLAFPAELPCGIDDSSYGAV